MKSSFSQTARPVTVAGGRRVLVIVAINVVAVGCGAPQPTTQPTREAGPAAGDERKPRDAAPVPPVDPSDQSAARTHRVVSGDTLFSLAKKYYGDTNQYRRIYYANRNRISNPRNIPVGMKLIIPPPPK